MEDSPLKQQTRGRGKSDGWTLGWNNVGGILLWMQTEKTDNQNGDWQIKPIIVIGSFPYIILGKKFPILKSGSWLPSYISVKIPTNFLESIFTWGRFCRNVQMRNICGVYFLLTVVYCLLYFLFDLSRRGRHVQLTVDRCRINRKDGIRSIKDRFKKVWVGCGTFPCLVHCPVSLVLTL